MKLTVIFCSALVALAVCCPSTTTPDETGVTCRMDLLDHAHRCLLGGDGEEGWARKVVWPTGPGFPRMTIKSGPLGCAMCWKRAAEYYYDPVAGMERELAHRVMNFCEISMTGTKPAGEYLFHIRSRAIYCGTGMCRKCVLCSIKGQKQAGKTECVQC